MRILGYIHTFNDDDVIERSLQALSNQTYPVDEVLIVDNGSTDGTLSRTFPRSVTIIRHPTNLGTSGAVITGLQYAMDKRYDWIWLLDADSAPRQDALEKLVGLYRGLREDLQCQTWLVAGLTMSCTNTAHGAKFSSRGIIEAPRNPAQGFYECDVTVWSGSLYKLEAVRKVGLPFADYVIDGDECEYAYRAKRLGYMAFMHEGSIIDHDIGDHTPLYSSHQIGPLRFNILDIRPMRCYYMFRNTVYFWLYVYQEGGVTALLAQREWMCKHLLKLLLLSRWPELQASLRGLKDGVCKRIERRF
jgi:rhamnopyranosyl-N-acetylglucosaminyl-diphospho-decaprenol beta-1,3/1,4-galactofuranosyltransferase